MGPVDILDFICSPCPFIVGVMCRDDESLQEIASDPLIKQQMNTGLTVINVTTGLIRWTNDKHLKEKKLLKGSKILSYCFGGGGVEMDQYDKRMKHFFKNSESSLHSFQKFFTDGPSTREIITLISIKELIKNNHCKLCGLLAHYGGGWKLYAARHANSAEIDFSPKSMHIPIKRLLEYQTLFSNTQLMDSYFHARRLQHIGRNDNQFSRLFIADWVYFHWRKYKQRSC